MKHILSFLSAFFLATIMLVGGAFAQVTPYTLFGTSAFIESEYETDMAVQITSRQDSYGGVDLSIPEETRLEDITHLSTDYIVVTGTCGGGSPRFQISLFDPITETEKTLFAYIGESPTYACPREGWQTSGNVLEKGKFIDATQVGSLFYTAYEEALRHFGSYEVTSIELVVDSGWMFGSQSIAVDNIRLNDEMFAFATETTR